MADDMYDVDTSHAVWESSMSLKHTWYLDSGCPKRMTGLKSLLTDFKKKDGPKVVFGDNNEEAIIGIRTFKGMEIKLKEVFYVKGLKRNLISIIQLCDVG